MILKLVTGALVFVSFGVLVLVVAVALGVVAGQ